MKKKLSRIRDWNPYMERALELASIAESKGDIPVGAVILNIDGKIIAEAHNERELLKDPTAHAEILALRRAAEVEKNWRLTGCTMVLTLEPCVMCAGALSLSRIDRVVFGAGDDRYGAMGSCYKIHEDTKLNHVVEVIAGVRESDCRQKILNFFKSRRT